MPNSDGTPPHSFRPLIEELVTIVRNACGTMTPSAQSPPFTIMTQPTLVQQHALQLLSTITV
jgi:hypothetical protein